MQHVVDVWGVQRLVTVVQKGEDWVAAGYYRDVRIEAKGPTEAAALEAWKEATKRRGH